MARTKKTSAVGETLEKVEQELSKLEPVDPSFIGLAKEDDKTVNFDGALLPKKEAGLPFVPKLNQNYVFGPWTFDIATDLFENKSILLTGHAGVGKSSVFQQIASRIGQPVLRANLNGQMSVSELVGTWTVKSGETVWVDGVLTTAMRNGYWLVLDEIDCGDAEILASLNTVLEPLDPDSPFDTPRYLTLKEKGHEVVQSHENFRIVATANSVGEMQVYRHLYQGTRPMNDAFLDRFRVYVMSYPSEADEAQILTRTFTSAGLHPSLALKLVQTANLVRDGFVRQEIRSTFSIRRLFDFTAQILRYKRKAGEVKSSKELNDIIHKAAEASFFAKMVKEDQEVVREIITRTLNTK
jgi:cobaltochelatase CobS